MFYVCFIEGGAFGGIVSFLFTHYKVVYGCIDVHEYKSILFWLICGLKAKPWV